MAPESIKGLLDATDGLTDEYKEKIKKGLALLDCDVCRVANMETKSPDKEADVAAMQEEGFVASDIKGPLPECKVGPFKGARWMCIYKDVKRKFVGLYFIRRKAGALDAYKKFKSDVRSIKAGYVVRVLRHDGGGEYENDAFADECARDGTKKECGPPYTPNHTLCESEWRTIGRVIRAGLHESGLALGMWPYFASLAATLINNMERDGEPSGYEQLTGVKPNDIKNMRPIGCKAVVRKNVRETQQQAGSAAIADRGWAGIHLGEDRRSHAFMVYVPELDKVKIVGRCPWGRIPIGAESCKPTCNGRQERSQDISGHGPI